MADHGPVMQIPSSFGRWVLSHPAVIAILIVVATIPCILSITTAEFDTSVIASFMSDKTDYLRYIERSDQLGGDADDFIYLATVEGDELFSTKKFNAIRRCAAELEKLPEVARVLCIANMPRLGGNDQRSARDIVARRALRLKLSQGELPDTGRSFPLYWPRSRRQQGKVDFEKVRQAMAENPSIQRVLLSDDEQAQVMILKLANADDIPALRRYTLLGDFRETAKRYELGPQGIHVTGVLVAQGFMYEQAQQALWTLFPAGILVTCVIIYLLFRRISIVILTNVIAAIAIAWALGITTFIYGEITILMSGIPLIVLVISTSDTIHLVSAYLTERESGCPHEVALQRTINEVGGACILTSVTTFIGFLSMMVVPAATTRHFALGSAIGVGSALLLALTLVPIALKWLQPKPRSELSSNVFNHGVDAFVDVCRRLSFRHPVGILVVAFLMIAAIVWYASDLRLDPDPVTRFRKSHPVRVAVDYFNAHLSGTNMVEVFLSADPDVLPSPDFADQIAAFETKCLEHEQVRSLFSLVSLYRIGNREIGFKTENGFPATTLTAHTFLKMLGAGKNEVVKQVVNLEEGITRVMVHVQPTALLDLYRLAEEIDAIGESVFASNISVETSGSLPTIGKAVDGIVQAHYNGFVICFVSVAVIVTLGLKSIRLGLLAVIPNLIPLLMLAGLLRLSGRTADSDILAVGIISIGLAVDDTIHFIHRFCIQLETERNVGKAVSSTFDYTGQAILRTTAILALGYLPFAWSGYFSLWMIGVYLGAVLIFAVFGDLLVLPALLMLFSGQQRIDESTSSVAEQGPRDLDRVTVEDESL